MTGTCLSVLRIFSDSGRAHFTIHSDSRTCLAVGQFSGLNDSIDRSIVEISIALCLVKRRHPTLSPRPLDIVLKTIRTLSKRVSVYRRSILGVFMLPCLPFLPPLRWQDTKSVDMLAVMSSWVAGKSSNNGLRAMIDHIEQASVHISGERERGFVGLKQASGGRIASGVRDSYFNSREGEKASPKSESKIPASASWISSLAFPSHIGAMPLDGTPGEVVCHLDGLPPQALVLHTRRTGFQRRDGQSAAVL